MGTAWTYAFRSLRRNARRTALSIVGIGIGCALALVMESLNRGRDELDRKSTRLNSSHMSESRMPSSA